MIILSDAEPTDRRGRPLHGRALQVAQAGEVRRRAEAEESATVRAVARALVKLCARGALSGPDALRGLIGEADAIRVLRMAGMSPEQTAETWQAAAPVQPAQSRTAALWASSPDHDPRMMAILTRPGVTDAEIAATRVSLAAEYRQAAAEKAARQQSPVMWHTRDGIPVRDGTAAPLGVSLGPDGAPVQRSVQLEERG